MESTTQADPAEAAFIAEYTADNNYPQASIQTARLAYRASIANTHLRQHPDDVSAHIAAARATLAAYDETLRVEAEQPEWDGILPLRFHDGSYLQDWTNNFDGRLRDLVALLDAV